MRKRKYTKFICTNCSTEFEVRNDTIKSRETSLCRSCINSSRSTYKSSGKNTKEGKAYLMYSTQVQRTKEHNLPSIGYSREEFIEWCLNNKEFNKLYDEWEELKFIKNKAPSIDRLNDYLGYSFNNIRVVTWEVNNFKGKKDRINGINNKVSKRVQQLTLDNIVVAEFVSTMEAQRQTGIDNAKISKVARGLPIKKGNKYSIPKTAGGFIWKYV